ncbi:MAG: type II secretion system F family protein [Methanobrevibacter sp.]|nr:type II secretion system F family protein [Methanobrevibacter sp.]
MKTENKVDSYISNIRKQENEELLLKQIMLNDEKKSDNIEKIRAYVINHINFKIISIASLSIVVSGLLLGMEISVIMFITIFSMLGLILHYPKLNQKRQYNDLNIELPYALRHMSTELKSGKGLYDTLTTIANSNYGSLSKEFERVLEEIKYGNNNEKALINMADRINSEGLTRAIQQIITTLRIGGNLANSLNIIAEDISFDMQIKLKEYSQKLNGFILIYTFIAILGPVILLIMLMAASTVMGDIVPGNLILILYVFFFPLVVIFLGVIIQKLEPKI